MITHYRKRIGRKKGDVEYYELDCQFGGVELYGLRYFPSYEKVYAAKYQNSYTKKWYFAYKVADELLKEIFEECKAHSVLGKIEVIRQPVDEPIKEIVVPKELEVNTDGDTWQGEEWCLKWYKCSVKQYSEKFHRPTRQKG